MRQRVIEAYPIRPADTLLTYLLIDDSVPTGALRQSRSRPFFICPAGYYSRKSLETLLSGYKEYLASGHTSGWALVFAGYNDDRRQVLGDLVQSLNLGNEVEVADNAEKETWASLLRAASGLLYPPLHEGCGIPVLEAFRYSVPVICSSVGGLPEVAGDAAIYVNPQSAAEITQAMLRISSSAETRSGLVKIGSRRLEAFNPDEQVNRLREAFLDLCTAK
jgi:glycosyltransferase involved in cell wall biosynthesis